jgi:hypothetical protein
MTEEQLVTKYFLDEAEDLYKMSVLAGSSAQIWKASKLVSEWRLKYIEIILTKQQ